MVPVIAVDRLTKFYGKARGIQDVSFQVEGGEVFGFLGPNGAGKTTTLRLLMDLIRPTSGRASLLGQDARAGATAIHADVGYLPGELGLPDRLTAGQYLAYLAGLGGRASARRLRPLAARFRLDLAQRIGEMSHGNRQKVGIVQAFMHDPHLLLLDEPTNGLDPLMQEEFHRLVREERERGRTVLLSSHNLPEVEELCDRVALIRDGRLLAVHRVEELKAKAVRRARIRFRRGLPISRLRRIPGVSHVAKENGDVVCDVSGPAGPLVAALARLGVHDLRLREPNLEDVFMPFYRGRKR